MATAKRIIGLMGHAGAGKSVVSRALFYHHDFYGMKFASGLKDMLRAVGLTGEEIEGGLKEKPCALLCGKTPRHAMITLGTEWGRNCIDPNFWVAVMANKIAKSTHDRIVIDDVRFANEYHMIKSLGGEIWLIQRPGCGPRFDHPSETEHLSLAPDRWILNDSTIRDLELLVHKYV